MLQPKRTKYRKQHKMNPKGVAHKGSTISFGSIALKAVTGGRLTARQIEAARRALTRHIKRQGKVWIRVFPDVPVSKKPLEVRMGKGKGPVDHYVAVVKPGRILFEMDGVSPEVATEALRLAAQKLPVLTKTILRTDIRIA